MKIDAGKIILRYNGKMVYIDQEPVIDQSTNQPIIINGQPALTGGRLMRVGDVVSTILSTKKVDQFNILKADVLARRFYGQEGLIDIDEADLSALGEVIDHNDLFVPFVLAYVKRAILEAKEGKSSTGGKSKQ